MTSSPATRAADDVLAHETELPLRELSITPSTPDSNSADEADQHEIPRPTVDPFTNLTHDPFKVYTYKITAPNPTLTLPRNHPFRTTPTGYPIFRPRTGRASLASAPGFTDPRITAFVAHHTALYTQIGADPADRAGGMFTLRLACQVRGLVTYGTMDQVVARLVERAVRDAARGWSEISDGVGRVSVTEPPEAPVVVKEEEEDDGEPYLV